MLARIVAVDGARASAVVSGTKRTVLLSALEGPPPLPGDWVVVVAGLAVDRLDPAEAQALAALQDQLEEVDQ